jgi:hypothetical protein
MRGEENLALSGTFYTNVNSHWRLQLEWTATQNISANQSTITAKLYWMGLDSYGTTYSSATKDGAVTIDGSTSTFSGSGLAKLTGSEKKLIKTYSKTVTHNSDGTKSVALSAYFDVELTLSGTYYGRVSVSGTATLNTIPRASSISSSANWTAGNNLSISVSRASSSFTHIARVYVNGVKVYETSSGSKFGTSVTASLNQTEVFKQLNGKTSEDTKIELDTYSGSTKINTSTVYKTGTVTAPSASTAKIDNPAGVSTASGQGNSTVYIDQSVQISITRSNSNFTHKLVFKDANSGATIHEKTGVGTSYTWTPSASEMTSMYNKIPNSIEFDGQLDIYTYYGSYLVRSATNIDINYRVRNSEPTFGTGYSYKDINSATVNITGNNQYIIQGKSSVRFELPTSANASPKNGASIKEYVVSLGGQSVTLAYSSTATLSHDFGAVSGSANLALQVTAVDSRGFTVTTTKTVYVLPYSNPTIDGSAKRNGGFAEETTFDVKGSMSSLTIGTSSKNAITLARYRYKLRSEAWNTTTHPWRNFTVAYPTTSSYDATNQTQNLDIYEAYDVEFEIKDKLTTVTVSRVVSAGQPILFLDGGLNAVGVNMFPKTANALDVNGTIKIHPAQASAKVGEIFTADTKKSYIHFEKAESSNDPAYIMHETSNDSANVNRGVLHLCPTDDNDNVNDYVTIHGTNDPESIRLYTGGSAWFAGTVVVDGNIVTGGTIQGRGVQSSDSAFYTSGMGNSSNVDHIWHDDATNEWHLVSDGSPKQEGNTRIVAGQIRLTSTADVSATTDYGAIVIGHPTSGESMKMDANELSSFNNGGTSDLHLNPDGGKITINNSTKYTGSDNDGLAVYNGIRNYSNGGNGLELHGQDHAYIEYYAKGWDGSRSAYVGYSSASSDSFTIANQIGRVILTTNDGGYAEFMGLGSHDGLRMAGKAIMKWLSSSDTIQVRTSTDGAYGTMQAKISDASDRRLKRNIEKVQDGFLEEVKKSPVYTYNMQGHGDEEKFIGLITDEAPQEIVIPAQGDDQYEGINLYEMTTFLWKAVQELSTQVDYLENKLKMR